MSDKKFDIISVGVCCSFCFIKCNFIENFNLIYLKDCVMDCIMYVDRMPKIGETMKGFRKMY